MSTRAGWLEILGTQDRGWTLTWCVLGGSSLELYANEHCTHRHGVVTLSATARVACFSDPNAPGGCTEELRRQRPLGFVLDVESSCCDLERFPLQHDPAWIDGVHRQFLYFGVDDPKPDVLEEWITALDDAIGIQAAEGDGEGDEEDCLASDADEEEVVVDGTCHIDDFSDYEDDSAKRRSSLKQRMDSDWTMEAIAAAAASKKKKKKKKEGAPAGKYFIDDFSDYEDDEPARRSSLIDTLDQDWTELVASAPPVPKDSDGDEDEGDPAPPGAAAKKAAA
eukprot:TRINITY_DN48216_c0_g1_i1.p1 TRINITY_DN48216_c0_g1~~TRINITY_DN48216_c0_g1_i1.p1  ORF type:complete len:280 (-),score=72.39 TRINITY_DN48216_c0_g1_i1:99-938(-)